MRKTIFIHIGCGKTGSSALQNWLAQNTGALKRSGIRYPSGVADGARRFWCKSRGVPSEYAITSGNGVTMVNAVKQGDIETFVAKALRGARGHVLFSSEVFQSLNRDQLACLKKALDRKGVSVVIIAYIRNVYDIAYSSYLQLVKRHLYGKSFRDFAFAMKLPQQFGVVRKFEEFFEDMRLIHYETERPRGIEKAFLEALGLSKNALPAMSDKKVNRSLSVLEAELMRRANEAYVARFQDRNDVFSKKLSDALIYGDPERETELYVDREVVDTFRARFGDSVRELNERYFGDTRLKIFAPEGKRIVERAEAPDAAFGTVMSALIGAVEKADFSSCAASVSQVNTDEAVEGPLNIGDRRVVELMRDEAVARENSAARDAFVLMSAAQVLRPAGPFINRRLERYGQRFRIVDEHEPEAKGANKSET